MHAAEHRKGGLRRVSENIVLPFLSATAVGTILFASYELLADDFKVPVSVQGCQHV